MIAAQIEKWIQSEIKSCVGEGVYIDDINKPAGKGNMITDAEVLKTISESFAAESRELSVPKRFQRMCESSMFDDEIVLIEPEELLASHGIFALRDYQRALLESEHAEAEKHVLTAAESLLILTISPLLEAIVLAKIKKSEQSNVKAKERFREYYLFIDSSSN